MSKVMLAHLVSHFPLTSAIFNKDVQPIHSVKPFSLRCSSYSPDFPQKPVSPAQRLSPQPNKALQGSAELWGPFYRKYMCVHMDTCVCVCAWAGGDLFKVYSLKNSVRQLSCCSKGFWGVKTAPACVRRLLGKQDMVGRQQWHTCLRKRARNATAACKCAACSWGFAEEDRPSQPHLWEEAGVSLRQRPGKLRGLNQTAGCRRPPRGQSAEIQSCPPRPPLVQGEQGVPSSATPGITDKGMEKGFLLCNTGYHR